MLEDRPKFPVLRVLAGLLLVVIIIGGGLMLYRAGFTHGALSGGNGALDFYRFDRSPHGMVYYPHFFPGGFLIGLLFFFLIFGLARRAFFGPRWGMHRMHRGGWEEKAIQWHTEQHAKTDAPPSAAPDIKPDDTPEA